MFKPTRNLQYDPKVIPKVKSTELKDLLKASYQRNTPAKEIGKKYGYVLDEDLSNAEQKVYLDKDKNPKIVFTGTRKGSDLITDTALAFGFAGVTPRFRRSSQLVDNVKQKYKNRPITALGHSLGGSLAESVANKVDKVVTLDRGIGLFGIGRKNKSNVTDVRTSNDIFSVVRNTQTGGKKVTIKARDVFNPSKSHDIKMLDKINNTF